MDYFMVNKKYRSLVYYGSIAFIITGVTLYVLSTIDLIPNKLGFWGFIDDGIVVLLGYLLYRKIRKKYKKLERRSKK